MPNLADVIRRFCTLFGVFVFCLIALGYTEAAGWVDILFLMFFVTAFFGWVLRPLLGSEGDKKGATNGDAVPLTLVAVSELRL